LLPGEGFRFHPVGLDGKKSGQDALNLGGFMAAHRIQKKGHPGDIYRPRLSLFQGCAAP